MNEEDWKWYSEWRPFISTWISTAPLNYSTVKNDSYNFIFKHKIDLALDEICHIINDYHISHVSIAASSTS